MWLAGLRKSWSIRTGVLSSQLCAHLDIHERMRTSADNLNSLTITGVFITLSEEHTTTVILRITIRHQRVRTNAAGWCSCALFIGVTDKHKSSLFIYQADNTCCLMNLYLSFSSSMHVCRSRTEHTSAIKCFTTNSVKVTTESWPTVVSCTHSVLLKNEAHEFRQGNAIFPFLKWSFMQS